MSGATHGKFWREIDLVENHARLNARLLHQAGALCEGAVTTWQWADGRKTNMLAAHGKIFLTGGDRVQEIRFGSLAHALINGGARMRFFCPLCNCGCYYLHDKAGMFACRRCSGYDWRCRHRGR